MKVRSVQSDGVKRGINAETESEKRLLRLGRWKRTDRTNANGVGDIQTLCCPYFSISSPFKKGRDNPQILK